MSGKTGKNQYTLTPAPRRNLKGAGVFVHIKVGLANIMPSLRNREQMQEFYGFKTVFLYCAGERPVIFLKFLKKVLKSE